MPYIAGAIVGTAVIGGGIQMWQAEIGRDRQRAETRRAEALNIKFANEENEREESFFKRGMAFKEKGFKATQKQQRFQNTQAILDNINNLSQNDFVKSQQLAQSNRNRGNRSR